ncbi:MAG: triphosphatase [Clostridia bacterium]|nr:triphosphatase [Clostridia bacterium]
MDANIETELKLQLTDTLRWADILSDSQLLELANPPFFKSEDYEAFYFDTPSFSLKKAGIAYRVRREGEKLTATIKVGGSSHGGMHERQEWNIEVQKTEPDLTPFFNTPFRLLLEKALNGENLEELFVTRFERKSLNLCLTDGTEVDFAADRGEIVAGDYKEPINEIELELKKGDKGQLLKLGDMLIKKYPLIKEPRSKFYRGLKLLELNS